MGMDAAPQHSARDFVRRIPVSWRALAVILYVSAFFGAPLLPALTIWLLVPANRFLRTHAFLAASLDALFLVFSALFRLYSYLTVLEGDLGFLTPEEFLGMVLSADETGALIMIGFMAALFFLLVLLPSARHAMESPRAGMLDREEQGFPLGREARPAHLCPVGRAEKGAALTAVLSIGAKGPKAIIGACFLVPVRGHP